MKINDLMEPMRLTGATLGLVATIATLLVVKGQQRIIWNQTDSLPVGFYWATRLSEPPVKGQLVGLTLEGELGEFALSRGYLKPQALLLKQVAGVAGERWCLQPDTLAFEVEGVRWGSIKRFDRMHRPMPAQPMGCRTIKAGRVVLGTTHPQSFDSRYFGEIEITQIGWKLEALCTW